VFWLPWVFSNSFLVTPFFRLFFPLNLTAILIYFIPPFFTLDYFTMRLVYLIIESRMVTRLMNKESDRMWKEAVVAWFTSHHLPKRIGEKHGKPQPGYRDSNRPPPEYNSKALPLCQSPRSSILAYLVCLFFLLYSFLSISSFSPDVPFSLFSLFLKSTSRHIRSSCCLCVYVLP
jgi:hypothetical protein